MNLQNDRVYAPLATKKRDISANRLLRTRSTHFQQVYYGLDQSRYQTGL